MQTSDLGLQQSGTAFLSDFYLEIPCLAPHAKMTKFRKFPLFDPSLPNMDCPLFGDTIVFEMSG